MPFYQKKAQVNVTFNVPSTGSDSILTPAFNDLATISQSPLINNFKINVPGGDEKNGIRNGRFLLADVLKELSRYISTQDHIKETLLGQKNVSDAQAAFIVIMSIEDDDGMEGSTITIEDASDSSIFIDGTWPMQDLLLTLGKLIDIAIITNAPEEQLKHLGVFG